MYINYHNAVKMNFIVAFRNRVNKKSCKVNNDNFGSKRKDYESANSGDECAKIAYKTQLLNF